MGVGSLVVLAVDVVAINHLGRTSVPLLIGLGIVAVIGLFVMSGATPAALGLLADVSEGFEDDRSAIMGLYSVFLGLGQVIGAAVGAWAASWKGIDGLVVATAILLAIGMAALVNLRVHEADFVDGTASGSGGGSIRVAIRANMPPPGGVGTRPREAATKEDR
jgi:predicted MFS family arabinose efflux permease